MAEQTTIVTRTETPEAFLADRQHFWNAFTRGSMVAIAFVVFVLIMLGIFLT